MIDPKSRQPEFPASDETLPFPELPEPPDDAQVASLLQDVTQFHLPGLSPQDLLKLETSAQWERRLAWFQSPDNAALRERFARAARQRFLAQPDQRTPPAHVTERLLALSNDPDQSVKEEALKALMVSDLGLLSTNQRDALFDSVREELPRRDDIMQDLWLGLASGLFDHLASYQRLDMLDFVSDLTTYDSWITALMGATLLRDVFPKLRPGHERNLGLAIVADAMADSRRRVKETAISIVESHFDSIDSSSWRGALLRLPACAVSSQSSISQPAADLLKLAIRRFPELRGVFLDSLKKSLHLGEPEIRLKTAELFGEIMHLFEGKQQLRMVHELKLYLGENHPEDRVPARKSFIKFFRTMIYGGHWQMARAVRVILDSAPRSPEMIESIKILEKSLKGFYDEDNTRLYVMAPLVTSPDRRVRRAADVLSRAAMADFTPKNYRTRIQAVGDLIASGEPAALAAAHESMNEAIPHIATSDEIHLTDRLLERSRHTSIMGAEFADKISKDVIFKQARERFALSRPPKRVFSGWMSKAAFVLTSPIRLFR